MEEIISAAVLIATLFGGGIVGERIYVNTRKAALTKAAQGLPSLLALSHGLTRREIHGRSPKDK